MPLSKPYHRIWRPLHLFTNTIEAMFEDGEEKSSANLQYLNSGLYADQEEKKSLFTATRMILQDIHDLFLYIEPCDNNKNVYSHRLYELLLRSATEFETNCKAILEANHYAHTGNLNIIDYFKINNATKLAEYKVVFYHWQDNREWKPFDEWHHGHSLSWYQAYNQVKHNRLQTFAEANLENVMNAAAALVCVLHSQFSDDVGVVDLGKIAVASLSQYEVDNNTFHLYAPKFPEAEQYDFKWNALKTQACPVDNYEF